jgi:cyclase
VDSGGTIDGLIESANRVLARANDETQIVPGHGPLASRADLKKFASMLSDVKSRVQKGIQSGKTMHQFIESKPLADLEAEWGDGFINPDQMATFVWISLTAR